MNSFLELFFCTAKAARLSCQNWHYSGRSPVFKAVRIGVRENGKFIGVILFGQGASAHLAQSFGLKRTEIAELTRIALREHKTPVSRMIRIAVNILKKQSPGIRLLVSFADPAHGHHGGIYQGSNWVYTGMSSGGDEWFFNGSWRHTTDMVKRFPKTYRYLPRRKASNKHRYCYVIDASLKDLIESRRQKPPKRAGSIANDAATFQVDEGGVTPTPALQNQSVID